MTHYTSMSQSDEDEQVPVYFAKDPPVEVARWLRVHGWARLSPDRVGMAGFGKHQHTATWPIALAVQLILSVKTWNGERENEAGT